MLKIQFRHKSERIIDIENAVSTLGRHENNDIMIDDPDILDFHAEFHVQDNSVFLLCLGENNQTLVNNETFTLWRQLQVGDVIEFGTEILDVIDSANKPNDDLHQPAKPKESFNLDSTEPWLLIGTNTAYGKLAIPNNKTIVVGRDPDCDIVIREGLISRRHTEIILKNNTLYVKDLRSTNGTFINSKRINEAYAKHDDEVRFDDAAFRVVDPQQHNVSSLLDAYDPSVTGQRLMNSQPSLEFNRQEPLDHGDKQSNPDDLLDFGDQPYFIGFSSLIKDQRFLLNKPHMTIGRASLSDITLEVATISVEHAEIVFEDEAWFINDVGSLNGTFINDKKILSAKLNTNDIVKFGTVELKFYDTTSHTKPNDGSDIDEVRSPIGRTVEYVQNLFGAKTSSSVADDKKKREFNSF